MESYLYSLESIMQMLMECYGRGNAYETGGILIGPKSHERVITDALASSCFAERQPFTYCQNERDVEILNQQLRSYQERGFDFRGYFHRHPPGLTTLSDGDIKSCVETLESPDYSINNKLLMVIVTESCGEHLSFPVFSYAVSLGSAGEPVVRSVSIKVMPKQCIEVFCGVKKDNLIMGGYDEKSNRFRQCDRTVEKP